MTNTTQNSVDIAAAKAAEELQAAKDKARALEAKAELAEAQRKEQAAAARLKFEQARRDNFQRDYMQPVKQARADFEQTVATGGNTLAAWITYMEAVHKAAAENARFTAFFEQRDQERYDHIARQISEWNNELAHADRTGYTRPAYDKGTEPRGPWSITIDLLTDKVKRSTTTPANRVQQINVEVNALAAALQRPLNRDLDSTEHIMIQQLAETPSPAIGQPNRVDRYETRSYTKALQQAMDKHLQQVEQDHRASVQQQIQQSTPGK